MKFHYRGRVLELTPDEIQQVRADVIVAKVLSDLEYTNRRFVELIHARERAISEAAKPFLDAKLWRGTEG